MTLINNAEIKQTAYKEVGAKLEELLDQAERDSHEAAGARKALTAHLQNLVGIQTAADAELEKSIPDAPTLKLVKEWIGRTIISTQQFARHWGNVEMQMAGEAQAHRATHDLLQKLVATSQSQIDAVTEAIAQGDVKVGDDGELESTGKHRPVGVRPMSMMQQRRAEEAAEANPPKKTRKRKSKKVVE